MCMQKPGSELAEGWAKPPEEGGDNVIEFNGRKKMLAKVEEYLLDPDLFEAERKTAVTLMLRCMDFAEGDVKSEIVEHLAIFAPREAGWPLYRVMSDPEEDAEERDWASCRLSVVTGFLKDPGPLVNRLLEDVKAEEPNLRRLAAFALGWEGNERAVVPLIGLLYDPDRRVRQSAVNALCNLRDEQLLGLLADRLENGPVDQKHTILLNLWRFQGRKEEVLALYRKYCGHADPDVRLEAFVSLGLLTEPGEEVEIYRLALGDGNPRMRQVALRHLLEATDRDALAAFAEQIKRLLSEPDVETWRLAIECLKRLGVDGVAEVSA